MSLLKIFLAGCPNCDGHMVAARTGQVIEMPRARWTNEIPETPVCERCGVIVSFRECGWRFPAEATLRPLPGILGVLFDYRQSRRTAA